MARGQKNFDLHDRKNLGCLKPNVSRNTDAKSAFGDDPEGNEESVIIYWERDPFCHIMVEKLAELCPTVVHKAEFVSNETGYLAKEIFK